MNTCNGMDTTCYGYYLLMGHKYKYHGIQPINTHYC